MRFLKRFIGMMVLAGIFLGIFYVVFVEANAWYAAWTFKQGVMRIFAWSKEPLEQHADICKKENSLGTKKGEGIYANLAGYQIRFTNKKNYVTEVVCGTDIKTYIKIKEGKLPLQVRKTLGSGIYVSQITAGKTEIPRGGVQLQKGYRKVFVGFDNGQPTLVYRLTPVPDYGDSLETTCEGWGGSCCVAGKQTGVGLPLSSSDCKGQCFAACKQPPEIIRLYLGLNEGLIATIKSGDEVQISYEFSDADGLVTQAGIDFGDGESMSIPLGSDQVGVTERPSKLVNGHIGHRYHCEQAVCNYFARVWVQDNDGLINAPDGREFLEIRVEN